MNINFNNYDNYSKDFGKDSSSFRFSWMKIMFSRVGMFPPSLPKDILVVVVVCFVKVLW